MRKKGIPEVIGESSLNEGVKTRVKVRLELSEEFEVKVGVHQGSGAEGELSVSKVDPCGICGK